MSARHLHLASIPNVRTIGGLAVRGGRVREGAVYRSGSLRDATGDDLRRLAERGVTTFVDLRMPDEIDAGGGPPRLEPFGIRWVSMPLSGMTEAFRQIARPEVNDYVASSLHILDGAVAVVPALFALLSDAPGAVAYGCTLGKDRTGVVSALLLAALGADAGVLCDDYAESACCLARHGEKLAWLAAEKGVAVDELLRRMRADPAVMRGFLARVDGERGGVDICLRDAGVDAPLVERLRARLVVEDPC